MTDFLHIVYDEKFIDEMIYFMNDVGGLHQFVCCVWSKPTTLQYIKSDLIITETKEEIVKRIKQGEYHTIMIHYMQAWCYNFVEEVPLGKKIIWSAWGGDLYETTLFNKPILTINLWMPLTKNLIKTYSKPKHLPIPKQIKKLIKNFICLDLINQKRIFQKIDYVSTVLPSEFDLLKKKIGFRAQYIPFQYVNLHSEGDVAYVDTNANDILVGNSADSTNNHLDIIALLKKRHITNDLFIPLAYGDQEYKNRILPFLVASNIKLQTTYIPKIEYSHRLSLCKAAIFGHIRQQALYNVNRMLMQGSKVFFFKNSMVYQFYKSLGAYVYCIEDELTQSSINTFLTHSQMEHNAKVVQEMWNYDNVKQKFLTFAKKENLL